ncbi:penicillin-binding protein [Kribbella sandramycini]|uniref:Membrane peptidoglycan carboxypeptidase n=1 Tax=Kribbella sandramycini TaxID=60450 RepID=A0A7Y4KYB4_9ACTN|nr:transglycosylase domain-containing protein [Kribbella sandramycini]MBB6569979.1 membrane peptidoglycan carboxypeptidase [Kribbella sandramycini]NOL40197.1 penicillin-binding protein [Kribbella sandramycini]
MGASDKARSLITFVGVSVLSGALAAGLAIPLAGFAGLGTEQLAKTIDSLPRELVIEPVAVRSRMLAGDGSVIATLFEQNRVPVSLKRVAPIMKTAIIAIEDSRFYEHGALDPKGTVRAMVRNQSEGSVQQGGSSITQQYVKLSLIEKARTEAERQKATEVSYERKLTELRYAIALESELDKNTILERYLNLVNFGDGAYGVQVAAQHYFGTTAEKLNLPQAALLAGLVKNPTGYDPTNNLQRAKARRDLVLRRMLELKVISVHQANLALKTPVIDLKKVDPVPNGCASSRYPFYCDYVVSQLLANPALGRTVKERDHRLKTGGLTIRTGLDPRMQAAAQASIDQHARRTDTATAAVTIVQPGTGIVKAMVQSRPYGNGRHHTNYNYNVEKSYAGGYGGFQNGSTMKAFTVAAAIEKGIPLDYRINSPEQINLSNKKFRTCSGFTRDPKYTPRNSTRSGNLTMVEATRYSTNTYFLQLSQRVGLCSISGVAQRLGMYNAQTLEPLDEVISMTLGVGYVTPLQMANAYATFAARGVYCRPLIVLSVRDKANKPIATPRSQCKRALAPGVADGVNRVLSAVMDPGGTGGRLRFGNWDLAGKTGTIQDNKAVWFAGYAPNLAAAAVVADANLPYTNLMYGHTLDGRDISDPTGSGTAGPIWKTAIQGALRGLPLRRFTAPSTKILNGNRKPLPDVTGLDRTAATTLLRKAGFEVTIANQLVSSPVPTGKVAHTDPRPTAGATPGTLITIHLSKGPGAP